MLREVKFCGRCGEDRPLGEFGPNRSRKDGLQAYCREHQRQATKDCIEKDPTAQARWGRNHRIRLREAILEAYGGSCACCGESTPEFLHLDHIGGLPEEHKSSTHRTGRLSTGMIYAQVKAQGFPKDKYRLLCANCNSAFGFYGYCPHQREVTLHAA